MIRLRLRAALGSCLLAGLAACGSGDDSANIGDNSQSAAATSAEGEPSGAMANQGTAQAQRLNCSAINARRGEGPDVVGITIGMPAELALQKVACSDPAAVVNTRTRQDGSRWVEVEGGSQHLEVQLEGPAQDQRVTKVTRALSFGEGEQPVLADVTAQLESKYGRLLRYIHSTDPISFYSMRRADGSLFTDSDDPLFNTCVNSSLEAGCGNLRVHVNIYRARQNPELVARMHVFIDHVLYGERVRQAASQQARAADEQRRKQEVDAASGRRPTL